jgi:LysR family glycine cleavage system transcriptional activator
VLSSSTLASLRFFEAAARLLSFKAAALELHVTQGAVSQQIKNLEEALGCKLFYRLPRQITLTEEGRRFAAVVRRSLEAIETEAQDIAALGATVDIRLRAGPSFALRWLVPRLGNFYAAHPHIRLYVNAAYGYFDPARREFDLAIELMGEPLPALRCEFLMDEYLVPVCTPLYRAKKKLKKPEDLARCALLHDAEPWDGSTQDAEWRYWLDNVGVTGIDSTQGQFFSLANMAIEAALNQQGVAMGRAALVQDQLESGELVSPFKQRVKSPQKYYLLYPQERAARAEMKAVITWLQQQATPGPA